ncbi:glycosyltransferase [Polynucleobacter paneuropaeus]|nr:glycosyltransferase [Polynucleobacter paneuropaeus]
MNQINNSNAPTVSWLLCSNVVSDYLKRAIQSCLNQNFSDFELIFVANGPNCQTIATQVGEWFGSDQRLEIIKTPMRHLNFSLNLGLNFARASLIARMDADDIAYPDRLALQVDFMAENPDVAVLGSTFDLIDSVDRKIAYSKVPEGNCGIRKSLIYRNPICHPSVIFRREVVLSVGGYLGGLYAEDYDLWVRLSNDPKIIFANLKIPLLGYRRFGAEARSAKLAYVTQASTQLRQFLMGFGFIWLWAALYTMLKMMFKGK